MDNTGLNYTTFYLESIQNYHGFGMSKELGTI